VKRLRILRRQRIRREWTVVRLSPLVPAIEWWIDRHPADLDDEPFCLSSPFVRSEGKAVGNLDLVQAVAALQSFSGSNLTAKLSEIEASLRNVTAESCASAVASCGARDEILAAAGVVKSVAGQINVLVHALGILISLPHLLEPAETIQYVSLGAGNTGRPFDLETDRRIAEFKFIRWQGGPEVIRQNALFKDFYLLAEHPGDKRKYLYVLGDEYPLKFFKSGRSLSSVLSRHVALREQFREKFGDQYRTVRDYYKSRLGEVAIQDISSLVAGLAPAEIDQGEPAI
jgi:hypothetical protein